MNGQPVARIARTLRHRQGLTQESLSSKSGVARWRIVWLESGRVDALRVGDVEQILDALGARFYLGVSHNGAALDRLLDEVHAALVGSFVELLQRLGWESRVEISFSEFGDRGSIDILAWHAASRALLVVEIKSELGSVEGTLRPLDVKGRLAAKLARERFGWDAASVSRVLVFPEDRTVRRQVERHGRVLRSALPARSRALRSWLAAPIGSINGIWFLTNASPANVKRNPSSLRRVRRGSPRSDLPDMTSRRPRRAA